MILRIVFCVTCALTLTATRAALADESAPPEAQATEATPAEAKPADATRYLLRYKFAPDEQMRWKIVHQALVRSTVSGTTQTAETRSESIKVWQIKSVDEAAGQATFVHSVESVDMRQSVSGRQDIRFNSLTDAVAPAEFEEVAKAVGIPLSTVILDTRGHIVKRREERAQPNANPGEMTVPLPEQEVAVGETWSLPHDATVRQKDGSTKQIKTRQDFTLTEVDKGIATIRIETIVLTPVRDPALEAQLIQHVTDGLVRFDIAKGCVVGQQTDVDKRVIGFQGEASSMHYVTRFTEELLPHAAATASKEKPVAKSDVAATEGAKSAAEKPVAKAPPAAAAAKTAKPAGNKPNAATSGKKAPPRPANKQAATKPKAKTSNRPTAGQQPRR